MKHILKRAWKHHPSELLTCCLVASMLAVPIEDRYPRFGAGLALIHLVLLLVAASYMAPPRFTRWLLAPVSIVWFALRLTESFLYIPAAATPIAGFALSCTIVIGLLRRFRTVARVTAGIISESILTYLMIAIAFAQLYWILDRISGPIFQGSLSLRSQSSFLYFSMTTLSGLGYSSGFPTAHFVQLLSAFENMIGLFYIALVVSRFVSAYRIAEDKQELQLLREIHKMLGNALAAAPDTSTRSHSSRRFPHEEGIAEAAHRLNGPGQ